MAGVFLSLACFVLVAALMPAACRLANSSGFIDHPGGRKRHKQAVPAIGGLVVFAVYLLSLFFLPAIPARFVWLVAGLLLLLAMGALDDWRELPPRVKFILQFAAAILIVVPGKVNIASLGDLFGFGNFYLGFMSIPFSVIATVLLINAVNLMDGVDGLAGGAAIVIFGWFAAASAMAHHGLYVQLLLPLIAAIAGFLVHNMRRPGRARASVFLGDAGSLAIGLCIAWFSLRLGDGPVPVIQPIGIAWLLALPIMDTCGQFARRVRDGRHPFSPDHYHFHHLLLAAGLSPGRAAFVIHCIVFFTGLIGVGGSMAGVPLPLLTAAWICALFTHMWFCLRPGRMLLMVKAIFGRFA
jgi:UDP-GlcNAc:undecaprenyl-phosphate GlcNAc-1-phosphate transferase